MSYDTLTLQQFTDMLAKETYKMFEAQGAKQGPEFLKYVPSLFVSSIVKLLIDKALAKKVRKGATKNEEYAFTSRNFQEVKQGIQNAVSEGFQLSLSGYSGKPVEYYCLIKPVPEPTNKLVS